METELGGNDGNDPSLPSVRAWGRLDVVAHGLDFPYSIALEGAIIHPWVYRDVH
jgi:hypothetical protein